MVYNLFTIDGKYIHPVAAFALLANIKTKIRAEIKSFKAWEDITTFTNIEDLEVPAKFFELDDNETKKAVAAAAELDGPVYLRMARLATTVYDPMPFEIGKGNVMRDGKDAVIFACGLMVDESMKAAEILKDKGYDVAVVNMHTIKPLDAELVKTYADKCKNVFTAEEHSVIGGLGDAVADVLVGNGEYRFTKLGVNDVFGQSGKAMDVLREYGLCADQIAEKIAAKL